ncbi:hypothetical protein [Actinopolymorpha singaporensis]|uniref:hypothetical protein n=1 Tax=Actinopolymorpha singaporensis TaxID=117157 RepID=UPI000B89E842|nr:hypothetical protein [Actinopolymorpha singaporensis]
MARMSVEEKVGQLLVTHVYGAAADSAGARNTAEYGVATPAEVVAKYHHGGVCYSTWSGNVGAAAGGALARILCGEVGPHGRLPVEIPTADGAGVLYPYGHGLTW